MDNADEEAILLKFRGASCSRYCPSAARRKRFAATELPAGLRTRNLRPNITLRAPPGEKKHLLVVQILIMVGEPTLLQALDSPLVSNSVTRPSMNKLKPQGRLKFRWPSLKSYEAYRASKYRAERALLLANQDNVPIKHGRRFASWRHQAIPGG